MEKQSLLNIFSASAGSGKTYTLVKEFLRIVLSSDDEYKFRRVLAMTFTNKAANEMKERIVKALVDLGTAEAECSEQQLTYQVELSKEFGINRMLLRNRSKDILNNILHHYSHFSVMTIDKFTHKVIRTFARDLNLSFDFDVELDLGKLRKEVTDLLFDQIGRNPELTRLMLNYVSRQMNEDKSWNFSNQLLDFSKQLFKEGAISAISLLKDCSADDFLNAQEQLMKDCAIFENKVQAEAKAAVDLIKSQGVERDDFHGKKTQSVANFFYKTLQASGSDYALPSDKLMTTASKELWGHPTSPSKSVVDGLTPTLRMHFETITAILERGLSNYVIKKEVLKNLNNLSLMSHYLRIIEEVKEENNKLLISDFYQKIAEIIAREPVPFIYERLGVRYEHFLLDEFQDTSQLQWTNLVPLLHNSLASGHKNLIVGDAKQAIYRWRNGEVEQFIQLPDKIHNPENIQSLREAESTFSSLGERFSLDTNYRSNAGIVAFNNALFDYLKDKLSTHAAIYEDAEQETKHTDQAQVKVLMRDKLAEDEELEFIRKSIEEAKSKGYGLSDIAVLCRQNREGAIVGRFLAGLGYDVISAESLYIGNSPEVKLLISILHALTNAHDRNYKLKALEHYSVLIEKSNPDAFIQEHRSTIESQNILQLFQTFDIELPQRGDHHNLYDYVEVIVEEFDFHAHQDVYLQSFLDQVHLFEKKNNSSIRDFLEWFDNQGRKTSIKIPENTDAIQIMTIHKSKGLEYPIVICPFIDWSLSSRGEVAWIHDNTVEGIPAYFLNLNRKLESTDRSELYATEKGKAELDQMNLLYVAFTRARIALFISTNASVGLGKNWLKPFFEQSTLFTEIGDHYISGEIPEKDPKDKKTFSEFIASFSEGEKHKPLLSFRRSDDLEMNHLDQKKEYGNKIHRILSMIDSEKDVEAVLEKLRRKGIISESESTIFLTDIQELFSDPIFAGYFQFPSKNELRVVDCAGQTQIPDKVVFEDDQLKIVDFKTGQKTPDHRKQVSSYIQLFQNLGYENVVGELYYIHSQERLVVH